MSDDRYPILVEHLGKDQALRIVCVDCHAEETIGPDDIRNDGCFACPKDCGGYAVYKYDEADRCPNCHKFGFFPDACRPCCSRVCKLQNEYAHELAERAA